MCGHTVGSGESDPGQMEVRWQAPHHLPPPLPYSSPAGTEPALWPTGPGGAHEAGV